MPLQSKDMYTNRDLPNGAKILVSSDTMWSVIETIYNVRRRRTVLRMQKIMAPTIELARSKMKLFRWESKLMSFAYIFRRAVERLVLKAHKKEVASMVNPIIVQGVKNCFENTFCTSPRRLFFESTSAASSISSSSALSTFSPRIFWKVCWASSWRPLTASQYGVSGARSDKITAAVVISKPTVHRAL